MSCLTCAFDFLPNAASAFEAPPQNVNLRRGDVLFPIVPGGINGNLQKLTNDLTFRSLNRPNIFDPSMCHPNILQDLTRQIHNRA